MSLGIYMLSREQGEQAAGSSTRRNLSRPHNQTMQLTDRTYRALLCNLQAEIPWNLRSFCRIWTRWTLPAPTSQPFQMVELFLTRVISHSPLISCKVLLVVWSITEPVTGFRLCGEMKLGGNGLKVAVMPLSCCCFLLGNSSLASIFLVYVSIFRSYFKMTVRWKHCFKLEELWELLFYWS